MIHYSPIHSFSIQLISLIQETTAEGGTTVAPGDDGDEKTTAAPGLFKFAGGDSATLGAASSASRLQPPRPHGRRVRDSKRGRKTVSTTLAAPSQSVSYYVLEYVYMYVIASAFCIQFPGFVSPWTLGLGTRAAGRLGAGGG